MPALLTKVFARPCRTTSRRSSAHNSLPKTRLQAEQLGDRTLLSATAVLSDGFLTVSGDAANDNVVVRQSNSTTITVRDNTLGRDIGSFSSGQVTDIVLLGNNGNDRLVNETAKPAYFSGGNGNDVMIGGSGSDLFEDGVGNDTFTGGAGQDTLIRRGNRGFFTDGKASENDLARGLLPKGTRLTADELKATGALTVSKDGDRLIFAGPSGAGFALRSKWTGTAGSGRFSTNGAVVMETAYGDVTIIPASPVTTTVEVTNAVAAGAGVFKTINWGVIPGGGSIQGNPLNGILDQAGNAAGLNVDTPGVNYGIGLGDRVRALDGKAPVNNAVPYLFARMATGTTLSYNDSVSVSTPNNFSGTLAFAPGDGTVYASVSGLPAVSDLGVAVSPNGYIPYRPTLTPDGVSDPNILGHFYTRGALSLTDLRIPAGVRGELVLDLDANDDGRLVGMTRANIGQSVTSFINGLKTDPKAALLNTGNAVIRDIAVGFNGGVDLELEVITMNLGDASAWYKPGEIAFRARTGNPFRNEPILANFWPGSQFDVQGRMDFRGGRRDWNFKANVSGGKVLGFGTAGGFLEAGNTVLGGGGIRAGASMTGLAGFGNVTFNGDIKFNGDFRLTGVGSIAANLGSVIGGAAIGTLEIARQNGVFTTRATLVASFFVDIRIAGAGVIGAASFSLTAGPDGRVNFFGAGSLTLGGHVFGLPAGATTVAFIVDNSGISLFLPQPIGFQRINF